jgi:hypothetical protein
MPADVMGAVALDQLVLHDWDLAGATSQSFTCDPASTAAVLAFTGASARPPGTGCSARWPMTRECADIRPGARISQPRPAWTPESALTVNRGPDKADSRDGGGEGWRVHAKAARSGSDS